MSDFEDFAPPAPAGRVIPPAVQAKRDVDRVSILQDEYTKAKTPEDRAALTRELGRLGKAPAPASSFEDFGPQASFDDFKPGPVRPTGDPFSPENLAADNRQRFLHDLWFGTSPRSSAPTSLGDFGKAVVGEAAAAGDLIFGIPYQLVGVGAGLGMSARAIGEGNSRTQSARAFADASQAVTSLYDNPLHKLVLMAGLGRTGGEGEGKGTGLDTLMGNMTSLLEKGGDWIEGSTNGMIKSQEVQNLINTATAAAGGKGLAAGLKKILPSDLGIEGVKLSPSALRRVAAEKMREADPHDAAQVHNANLEEAAAAPPPSSGSPTLDSALTKVGAGQLWDLTAEERIAYKGWKDAQPEGTQPPSAPTPPPADRLDPNRPIFVPPGQRGAIDMDAFKPKQGEKGLTLADFQALSPALSLGSLLARSDYTLQTLERLDKARTSFGKQELQDAIKREGVSAPEKALVQSALDAVPGERISAKDLMVGVKKAGGDFELSPKVVDEFADYGLENIDRAERDPNYTLPDRQATEEFLADPELRRRANTPGERFPDYPYSQEQAASMLDQAQRDLNSLDARDRPPEYHPRTTLYQSPFTVDPGAANHFGDQNLFGWVRSFDEGGVRHVVEIQSDLVQKMRVLSEEEKGKLYQELNAVRLHADALRDKANEAMAAHQAAVERYIKEHGRAHPPTGPEILAKRELMNQARNEYGRAVVKRGELQSRYDAGQAAPRILPMAKNWWKRLVREELAQGAKGNPARAAELRAQLADRRFTGENMDSGYAQERLQWLKEAETPAPSVRFATADTAAKVEGWPNEQASLQGEAESLKYRIYKQEQDVADYDGRRSRALDELGWRIKRQAENPGNERVEMMVDSAKQNLRNINARYEELKDALLSLQESLKETTKKLDEAGNKPIFRPEHQTIYDRYRDIEKFLTTKLGGTPYTDPQGHTWIETPTRSGPTQQFGKADPKLLARLAVIGGGAYLGYQYGDEKSLMHAVLGAGAGLLLTRISGKQAARNLAKLAKQDTRLRIDALADRKEYLVKEAALNVWNLQRQIEGLVPTEARRNAITHALESGDSKGLSPKEEQALAIVKGFYDLKRWQGVDAGVLKDAMTGYVTHLWDWTHKEAAANLAAGGRVRFPTQGKIPTIAEGKAMGYTPLTEDISQLMGLYGNSLARAIANRWFVQSLKDEMFDPRGLAAAMRAKDAPLGYVSIDNPSFVGTKVHPDIAGTVRMSVEASDPGVAMKSLRALSDTVKRIAVSSSLFHAKALTDAMIGGSSNPIAAVGRLPGFIAGTNRYLQMLKQGTAAPLVARALRSGLEFSLEKANPVVEDAGAAFYKAMESVQQTLDSTIPHLGLPVKAFIKLSHGIDTIMWARLHAGMKLEMFAEKMQQLADRGVDPDRAGKIAASYTNDLFGGLNYRLIAQEAKSRWGRELAEATLNPAARRGLQILMFAPDWTISTTRAATQAFGRPDFLRPTTLAGLHQQYLLRSAAYYLVVGDAINYAMSGHHLWENGQQRKDQSPSARLDAMTKIELDPQGFQTMQWSKHTMEPVHWLVKPGQQALNKLGVIPKELATQALGVEYLKTSGDAPKMKNRLGHLAKNFVPIVGQQGMEGGAPAVVSGFLGTPITGVSAEERALRKVQSRLSRSPR